MEKNLSDFTSSSQYKNFLRAIIIIGVVVAVGVTVSILLESKKTGKPITTIVKVKKFEDVVRQSNVSGDPKPLQDYLITKLRRGENDNDVKSAIYWITHRYFDNGGDIYEIYSFVRSHPEVSFLNQAEVSYPDIFTKIKNKQIENYSLESLQALLAYYDVIDSNGYSDYPMWGLAANKYAELARISGTLKGSDGKVLKPAESADFKGFALNKSNYYINKFDSELARVSAKDHNLSHMSEGKRDEDVLVGLNQYVSAVQNLEGAGFKDSHIFSVKEIYEFNENLSRTKVARLYFFTNYLYATGFIFSGKANKETVKEPLDRIMTYIKAEPSALGAPHSSLARVVGSRTAKESSVYSKKNAVTLAKLHPEFKEWLKSNGWTDEDFR